MVGLEDRGRGESCEVGGVADGDVESGVDWEADLSLRRDFLRDELRGIAGGEGNLANSDY